jgi:hypothetical protein
MSASPAPREGAPRRYTSAALTAGAVVAGALFAVALVLEVLGVEPGSGEISDIAAVLQGLVELTPWAWASAGAYAVVATPVIGLLVTAAEYRSVEDRRTLLLAVAVLAVLSTSVVVAVLR